MGLFDRKHTMNRDRRPSPTVGASPSLFDKPTSTRQEAIHKLNKKELEDDALTVRHNQILDALEKLGPSTMKKVGEYLKIPINCITPRFIELRDWEPKRIAQDGKTKNDGSGYSAWKYKVIVTRKKLDDKRSASSDGAPVHQRA